MSTPNDLPAPEHLRAAFRVSVLSVAWTVAASTTAIAAGVVARALVLMIFGLTGVLDAAGSWALSLHFKHAITHQAVSEKRERVALRVVSFGLISIGVFTIEESTRRLATGSEPHSSTLGVAIATASIVALSALAARKRFVSRLVESTALLADGWLSGTGAALATIAVAGTVLGSHYHVTWIDPVAALTVAVSAAATGFRFLRREERDLA